MTGWRPLVVAVGSLLFAAATAGALRAQQPDSAGGDGAAGARDGSSESFGSFLFVERPDGARLLVVPDRNSSLNEGARLFLRCSDDRREVFVAVTEGEGRLGNARDGAGGRYRFGSLPWSDMVTWGSNEAGTAAFMPPRLTESFAARARESDRVEVQIVNPAGVRHRYVFPMDGLAEGTAKLACFRR